MYHKIATKLVVTSDTPAYSDAIEMAGHNTVQLDKTLVRLTGTSLAVSVLASNDKQNWSVISGSTETLSAEDYALGAAVTGIGSTYVRTKCALTGAKGQVAILTLGLNQSMQD